MVSDLQTTLLHRKNTRLTSWLNSKLLSSWAGVYRDLVVSCIQSLHRLEPQTVKKDFKSQGTRTKNKRQVVQALEEDLRASGCNIGYKQMTQRLVNDHRLVVGKENVLELLNILDPAEGKLRTRRRLKWTQYITKGPNHLWHIDGYDKLKPFGFCIHGAIHGFSWWFLWLEVGYTNNDPTVNSRYFVDCVRQLGGTARVRRADCGTENGYVAAVQRRDGEDDWAGDDSSIC